jgi:hypothetical protein
MPAATALVNAFAEKLGLGAIGFDADHPCTLCFDGKYVLTLQYDADDRALLVSGMVGPANAAPELLRALLSDSCLGARTGGAAFGLSPDTRELLLWKRWNDEFADQTALEAAIGQFLAQFIHWRTQIAEWSPSPAMPAPRSTTSSPAENPMLRNGNWSRA